jgi:hypothetical protein
MDSLLKGVGDIFLALGLPGAIIIILGWVIWQLWHQLNAIQEARIAEAYKSVESMSATSSALNQLSDLIRAGSRRDKDA